LTAVPPIQKRCRICQTVKLLNQFEIDERVKDKHESICKDCLAKKNLCTDCVETKIIETAQPMVDLLLDLVRDGIELPERFVKKIGDLALLAGMLVYCEDCNKKIS
jgi:hypothetical protein